MSAGKARILIVGGAGYVGSAAAAWLLDQGHAVHVLDDLSTGFRELVLPGAGFTQGRAGDRALVGELLARERFDAVMHFAARAQAGESVKKPAEYRENNVGQTTALMETLLPAGVRRVIFSSTCAIFGDPGESDLSEESPKRPLNPYGETKLEAERTMARLAAERGLQAVALRYFNAAGAEPGLRVGELHEPETHLIPCVLRAADAGGELELFGTDYPTPDGTCVRDYVHVWDLARAHGAALERLLSRDAGTGRFEAFNLGSEKGFSVREVIDACGRVVGRPIRVAERPRRAGDPPRLVADSGLARRELGFDPKSSTLERIIASAWEWHRRSR
ncbi:MAG TPA: UDP-glucose 4-epimerase GalE [Bdellovibrionota bacterium]|nr:UDP-glucose 4-epimerase GalE [Bdellovibrionota bacterium]